MKLDHFLIPYTKINSIWIKDLSVRPETIKLLEGSTGSNFSDMGHSNIFLGMAPEARDTKAKLLALYLNKKCLHSKGNNKQKFPERQPTEWEKIFASYISNKGLVSKIYREVIQLNTQKTNN